MGQIPATITTDQLLFGVAGIVFTLIGGLLLHWVKGYFDHLKESAKEKAQANAHNLTKTEQDLRDIVKGLATDLRTFRTEVVNSYSKIKDRMHAQELSSQKAIHELSTQVKMSNEASASTTREVHRLEARLDEHMNLISGFISSFKAINDKLDSVLRDASKRGTASADKA